MDVKVNTGMYDSKQITIILLSKYRNSACGGMKPDAIIWNHLVFATILLQRVPCVKELDQENI